jgi:hypothetical protein
MREPEHAHSHKQGEPRCHGSGVDTRVTNGSYRHPFTNHRGTEKQRRYFVCSSSKGKAKRISVSSVPLWFVMGG